MEHLANITAEQSQLIFDEIKKHLDNMTNYQFLNTMTKYAGYLSYDQRLELSKTYAKIDGDKQIRYMEENKKLREQFYQDKIKARLDPSLPINAPFNIEVAKKAAEEENKVRVLEKVFTEAKELSKNESVTIEEGRDPSKNVINAKAKRVIVKFQDGTISHINEETERRAMEAYKAQLQKNNDLHQGKKYDVGMDDEYS